MKTLWASYYYSHIVIRMGYGLSVGRNRWTWITLNDVMAVIIRYSTEFGSFGSQLRHSGW